MPHFLLEYSDNVLESDFNELFQRCHSVLVNRLPTQLESCKSRALKHALFYIGDGKPEHAFVSVSLKVMPGRSTDTLKKLGQELMTLLKTYFSDSLAKLNCQITLEISEITNIYFKLE